MRKSNLTVGKRIALGFGVVLALLAVLGVLSYTGVGGIVNNAELVINGNKLDGLLAQKEVDHLNWVNKANALLTDENVATLHVETDDHKCGFGQWLYSEARKGAEKMVPTLVPMLKEIEDPHRKLHESAIAIGKVFKQADAEIPVLLVEREVDHLNWASKVRDAFLAGSKSLDVETDPGKCALGKWLGTETARKAYGKGSADFKKAWDAMLESHRHLHESAIEIKEKLAVSVEEAKAVFDTKTAPLLEDTLKSLKRLHDEAEGELAGMEEARKIYATRTVPALQSVQATLHRIRDEARKNVMTDEAMLEAAHATKRNVTISGIAAVVAGILLAFFLARGIVSVLSRITGQMSEGATQVASASGQVSSASQSLAEGASEQAAAIEETSSSLEEMSAMTKQNAEHAHEADALMKKANEVVYEANAAMGELTTSMEAISKASEETSRIIKTIDEIAFQTNLLALNAAVEAARAGEAGAGFAVVADEVRNLAMRAAEAAKNTAGLIEGTVKKVKDGSGLVRKTNEAFGQVAENVVKVGGLIAEIAAASNEQAQGIDQVSKAVAQMDKVVQQTAANAEESASASEEMHSQCEMTYVMVKQLNALVTGDSGRDSGSHADASEAAPDTKPRRALLSMGETAGKKPVPAGPTGREVKPEELIPLKDEEFKDF